MIPVQEELQTAWKDFVTGDARRCHSVRPVIFESWKRCHANRVNPFQKVNSSVLDTDGLLKLFESNRELLQIALPVMNSLYRFVEGSGFVVTLANYNGHILEVIGDKTVLKAIAKGNFIPGADWSELKAGTNSIGTCLVESHPIQVYSYEHYCICSHRWTCSGAPIHDTPGEVIGVIDMTGPFEKVHPHTLGMVVASAEAIERQLATERAWRERDLANRFREALMSSISDGIIATDSSHRIIHMNREATNLLGVNPNNVFGVDIGDIVKSKDNESEEVIYGRRFITDQELNVDTATKNINLTVTSRPVSNDDGKCEGIVLVVNEIARARKLAQRISGAVARLTFDDIVGGNPKFKEALSLARMAAGTDSTVLLLGESGTGKDILAQAIHNASYRSYGPFVAINCGAIPRDLISSELFGYTEGAFTGAKKGGSPGKFELAEGGTIFLDEIGDMPTELQTTLLRVLEQKTVTRIGGTSVLPVNVRVIAATNQDLVTKVKLNNFRRDLFYRLNVVSIPVIPLRDRQEDVEELFLYFLNRLGTRMGKSIPSVAPNVWNALKGYRWPGNIRELQNVVERSLHFVKGSKLCLEHLPQEIINSANKAMSSVVPIANYEKKLIQNLLAEHEGNISQVATQMGIARTTLYRKMSKYGITH